MAAYTAYPQCSGTRWVRYSSEMVDGNFEEAFRLCPCNFEPETLGERGCYELERAEAMREELTSVLT